MILWAVRLLASLSRTQYLVILATIISPAIGFQFLPSSTPGELIIRPIIYVIWSAIAVLFVALMLREDKSKAEEGVNQKIKNLSNEVQTLKSEHQGLITGLGDRIDDVNSVMRDAFSQLNVTLPPPTVIGRPLPVNWKIQVSSVKVTLKQNRLKHSWQFVKQQAKRIKRWVYG